jgi:hypothetical protein
MAEFCLTRVVEAIDRQATVLNCVTACDPTAARIPIDYRTDRETLTTAIDTLGLQAARSPRILWIRNTLDLREIECSEALFAEAACREDLEVTTGPRALPLDQRGMLPEFPPDSGSPGRSPGRD